MADIEYEQVIERCWRGRKDSYPPISDQFGAAFEARQGGPTQQQALGAQIDAVKAKYPKPVSP